MKKTFIACLAVVALFAIATSASAITCTGDGRPAATLLIPYFQANVTVNPIDGSVQTTSGTSLLDTLVTIGNASSSPMLAHVSVFSERSEFVLDFNIALTGFDIQSWSMASILRGFLPSTPVNINHVPSVSGGSSVAVTGTQVNISGDVCQRNPAAFTNNFSGPCTPIIGGTNNTGNVPCSTPGGYLRVRPGLNTATGLDNFLATTQYSAGPFSQPFLNTIIDSLDGTSDTSTCGGAGVNGVITNPLRGYVTIDHANYCNLSNPSDSLYWTNDAAGMENNLWGDYIFISGAGIGTMGFPAVAIEADPSLFDPTQAPTSLTAPCNTIGGVPGGGPLVPSTENCIGRRTFYRRYVTVADVSTNADGLPCQATNRFPPFDTWNCGFGDQREPIGLKYAARWLDGSTPGTSGVGVTTNTSSFNVWRSSSVRSSVAGGRTDLLGTFSSGVALCNTSEPTVTLSFYDEDENTVTSGACPSPCTAPTFNFPLETQRTSITVFPHPNWPAGWVSMSFFNGFGPAFGDLDQAYVTYDFQGAGIFLSAGVVAAQLDPTACMPLQVIPCPVLTPQCAVPTAPVIPVIVGTGP